MFSKIAGYSAFFFVQTFFWLMMVTPLSVALSVSRGCVTVLCLVMHRAKKVGRKNLELVVPDKSPSERNEILKGSLDILAQHIVAFARFPKLTPEKAAQLYDYRHAKKILAEARDNPRGVGVLIGVAHFGLCEQLAQAQALLDRPVGVLVRGFGSFKLGKLIKRQREMHGNEVFSRKGGFPEVIRRLNQGQDVLVLFDQNIKANHATYLDFFGIKAATTKTMGLAALRTGAPVVFAASIDGIQGKSEVVVERVHNPIDDEGSREEKIDRITLDLHICLEKIIRRSPKHWLWIHRRYKTRPPGEPETIYD